MVSISGAALLVPTRSWPMSDARSLDGLPRVHLHPAATGAGDGGKPRDHALELLPRPDVLLVGAYLKEMRFEEIAVALRSRRPTSVPRRPRPEGSSHGEGDGGSPPPPRW
jgi:hypothetical protein